MKTFLAGADVGRWRPYCWDAVALSGLALLIALALTHVLQPAWRDVYLYNGDSLTLALLEKSLQAGEPFRWVLSSQLFLFPEGLLYALCAALATSVQSSFLINSTVGLALLYAGYCLLGCSILKTRQAGHAFALFSTGLMVLCMLCETSPGINGPTFVTLYLFSTYYYGVILCGLLILYWVVRVLEQSEDSHQSPSRLVWLLSGIFIVTALAYFSDPLFFLQCSAPLLAILCLLYFVRLVSCRFFALLVVPQLAGLALGSVGRGLCKAYVGNPVVQYIDFRNIAKSIDFLAGVFSKIARMPSALFEYGVMTSVLLTAVVTIILIWRRGCRERLSMRARVTAAEVLLALFALGSPMASISGALLTGNAWTRYWLPLAFFPVLAFLPLCSTYGRVNYGKALAVLATCVAAIAAFCGPRLYESAVQRSGSRTILDDMECYNQLMRQNPFNAVGGFWTTRALDLYSETGSRVLQVTSELRPFIWMNNRAPYFSLAFNGVIVNRPTSGRRAPDYIYADEVKRLGPYSMKFGCPTFDIYYYETGTAGFVLLNKLINK